MMYGRGDVYGGYNLAYVDALVSRGSTSFTSSSNFVDPDGATTTTKIYVVEKLLKEGAGFWAYYDQKDLGGKLYIDLAKGESFDPSAVTLEGKNADGSYFEYATTITVTKDGEVVTDYSEPGTYSVRVDIDVPDDLEYAGSKTFDLVVLGRRYSAQPNAWATIGGKDAKDAHVEYTGKAVTPVVTAKDGSATLTEGEDYTVVYKDADGEVVTEMVEPGVYTATVDFGQANYYDHGVAKDVEDIEFSFEITKAEIESAKADKDVYDVETGTVAPTFTAWTNKDLKGLSVAIDPATAGATYHKVKENAKGEPLYQWVKDAATGTWSYELQLEAGDLGASDLTESGWYVADLVVPADDAHFYGDVTSEPFQISEYATFSDVDAGSWYADAVYNANDLGYMTGIKGTDLFMPLADISRAELSKVFFNMAGQSEEEGVYFPSAFADVDGWAWYAQPVAWASEAGIVTGYDADTFGPMDKASREQVAVMLYRYAKAQGKDVSVKDADAALAAYKDGDQVSDWAKTAMAWAVENGIFGVDTDELWANQNIQRAAVASIAVRFQPEALPEA